MTIKELIEQASSQAVKSGFENKDVSKIPERLALIHSEVSEALEALRESDDLHMTRTGSNQKPDGFVVELADVVIRIADLCGQLNLDLENAITEKMFYNSRREYKHGKRF